MPEDLLKAHWDLDRAVTKRYGFSLRDTEADLVARLMTMCQAMTDSGK
ncbi:MAG: hypothetical protein LBF93_05060 [Zoogloeaceae bacterium]|jgi:hypothetical protein|nr:hypothetical protein [Zoogloeaceae bacterium]